MDVDGAGPEEMGMGGDGDGTTGVGWGWATESNSGLYLVCSDLVGEVASGESGCDNDNDAAHVVLADLFVITSVIIIVIVISVVVASRLVIALEPIDELFQRHVIRRPFEIQLRQMTNRR